MCIIAICKERALTDAEFKECFRMNNDGAGMAWKDRGQLHFVKGFMKVESALAAYKDNNMERKMPHVVHFRKATCTVTPTLTHPFIVTPNSPNRLEWSGTTPLLFHNGVMTGWRDRMFDFFVNRALPVPGGAFSDSRFIAILTHYLGKHGLTLMDGKFALFTLDNIDLIGQYIEEKGILFSNNTYRLPIHSRSSNTETNKCIELLPSQKDNICGIEGVSSKKFVLEREEEEEISSTTDEEGEGETETDTDKEPVLSVYDYFDRNTFKKGKKKHKNKKED